MQPKIDHLQITVKDLDETEKFYDKLMPILGFDLTRKGKGRVDAHDFDVIEYFHENVVIGFNSPREQFKEEVVHRRKPGSVHHLAFKAESPAEVDRLFALVRETGALIVNEPQYFPQHGEAYYAMFFKDPSGIKLEIMHEDRD